MAPELELVNNNSLPNSCCCSLQYHSLALLASWKANRRVNAELLSKPETKYCHDLEQCCTQMDCLCRYMTLHVVTDATILLTKRQPALHTQSKKFLTYFITCV